MCNFLIQTEVIEHYMTDIHFETPVSIFHSRVSQGQYEWDERMMSMDE